MPDERMFLSRRFLYDQGNAWNDPCYDRTFYAYETIDHYVAQLGGIPAKLAKKFTYGATGTGPTASVTLERSTVDASYNQKTNWLITQFENKGLLTKRRPTEMLRHDSQTILVRERCMARCFTISKSFLPPDMQMAALRVWMSEPDPADFTDEEWKWRGSYLFLTEIHLDNDSYHHIYSGCSALRMIANALSSKEPTHRAGKEILGRFDERSVMEKLTSLGGIPSEQRIIDALYFVRYMTDEQWHHDVGSSRRVHDILGYPLSIRSRLKTHHD